MKINGYTLFVERINQNNFSSALNMFEILSSVLVGLLTLWLISLYNQNFNGELPLAPLRLPIFGNLVQIAWINSKEPYRAFTKLGEIHGNIFSIQLGSVYCVVLNSFELMEEYLPKAEFSDRFFNDWVAERTCGKKLGIIFAKYPSPWHQLRRFSLRTLRNFGFGKRSKTQYIIHAEITDVVSELKTSINENEGIHTFNNYFTISALNVVWSMLAGKRYGHDDPKLLRMTKVAKELFLSCNVGNSPLLAFPEWKDWFPDWTGMSIQRKCYQETNEFFLEFIEERRLLGTYKTNPKNLIDEFLRKIDENWENDGESEFTDQQLVALMSDFFLAGSETTSSTLAWCVLYLILNPEVQSKLQNEVDLLVPNGKLPDVEHESQLHYVQATLAETHRMASVFPLMVPRATTENTFCEHYFIPKGTYVIANMHGVNYNKKYWNDPETFRPERFLDENGKFKSNPRLKPFGFGKRTCLGEPVASMSLIHYLTALMQNFSFHPVPNESLPSVNPVVGITNGPQTFRALVECRRC